MYRPAPPRTAVSAAVSYRRAKRLIGLLIPSLIPVRTGQAVVGEQTSRRKWYLFLLPVVIRFAGCTHDARALYIQCCPAAPRLAPGHNMQYDCYVLPMTRNCKSSPMRCDATCLPLPASIIKLDVATLLDASRCGAVCPAGHLHDDAASSDVLIQELGISFESPIFISSSRLPQSLLPRHVVPDN